MEFGVGCEDIGEDGGGGFVEERGDVKKDGVCREDVGIGYFHNIKCYRNPGNGNLFGWVWTSK